MDGLIPRATGSPPRQPSSRILIVEDDRSVAALLGRALESSGYTVSVATSVAQTRDLLVAERFELAILDRQLPDGTGLDVANLMSMVREQHPFYLLMLTSMSDVERVVEALDHGIDDYMTKPFQLPEVLARVRAGLRIVDLQKRLLEQNTRLETLSVTDGLTGLFNRRHFDLTIESAFAQAQRYDRPLSLAMIDVDHFKPINDTWGHTAGDRVLTEIAARITNCVRRSDMVARIGGEEIAIVLPETALFEAVTVGEKIRAEIASRPVTQGASEIPVTASIGIASLPITRLSSADEMIRCADAALYRAKWRRNSLAYERRTDPWRESSPSGSRTASSPHA